MQSEYVPNIFEQSEDGMPKNITPLSGYTCNISTADTVSPSSTEIFEEIGQIRSQLTDYHNMSEPDNLNDLKSLLSSWKLEFLLEHFTFELVNIEILKLINLRQLARLMSKYPMGTQILFENHLTKWREEIGIPIYEMKSTQTKMSSHKTSSSVTSDSPVSITATQINASQITLANILKESGKGSFILHYYEQIGKLQDEQRTILINMICQHFCDKNVNMSLAMSYRLEEEICERFKSEKLEFYRTGRRGKLYNRFCNLKSTFKPILLDTVPKKEEPSNKLIPETDADYCERSLKFDNLNVEEFDRTWQACSKYRLNDIKTMDNTRDIMQKWPFYKRPSGYRLIDMDFKVLFPKNNSLLDKWAEYSSHLSDFLFKEGNVKDKHVIARMHHLRQDRELSENSRNAVVLWSLHAYLVPTQKSVSKNNAGQKSVTKYSIRDSQDSFLFVGKSVQELDDHINFLLSKKSHIQPFILAIGSSIVDLQEIYVYLDGVKFSFSNFIRAADICFKTFHVFNLEYPLPATNFYTFMQELFYGIKNAKLRNTKISVLLNEVIRK